MPNLPTIHLIQTSDAPQHMGTLEEILQKFRTENRIIGFVTLSPDVQITNLPNKIKEGDGVLLLLTNGLEPHRNNISSKLKSLQKVKIAEIIVDKVPYEKDFITFPSDLSPVRGRADMDTVWKDIEKNLSDLFPKLPHDPIIKKDRKWIKYVLAALVLLFLVIGVLLLLSKRRGPEVAFNYQVFDPVSDEFYPDTAGCYAPCIVYFDNESRNYDSLIWNFGDNSLDRKENPKHLFLRPGEYTINLTGIAGSKKNSFNKKLLVKPPPVADFEINNDGCTAPCEVLFVNKSKNAVDANWEFGNNTRPSNENSPRKQYQTPGIYPVKLTVTNQDGITSDTVRKVSIREDDSPFAKFAYTKHGAFRSIPRKVTFENKSKNSDEYVWSFGDGSNGTSSANSPNTEHTYVIPGRYTIILTATKNNRPSTFAQEIVVGPEEKLPFPIHLLEKIRSEPELSKQMKFIKP